MNIFDRPLVEFDNHTRTLHIELRIIPSRLGDATSERFYSDYHAEVARLARSHPAILAAAKAEAAVPPKEEIARRVKTASIDVQMAALAIERAENDPRRAAKLDPLRTDLAAAQRQLASLEAVAGVLDAQERFSELSEQLAAAEGQIDLGTATEEFCAANRQHDAAQTAAAQVIADTRVMPLAAAKALVSHNQDIVPQHILPGDTSLTVAKLDLAKAKANLQKAQNDPALTQLRIALADAQKRLAEAHEVAARADSASLALQSARGAVIDIMNQRTSELRVAYSEETQAAHDDALAAILEPFSRAIVAQHLEGLARMAIVAAQTAEAVAEAAIQDISTPRGKKTSAA